MKTYFEKPLKNEQLPIRISKGCTLAGFPKHWHTEMEVIHVIEGNLIVYLNNQECSLEKGDILIIGANKIHGYKEGIEKRNFDLILFNYGMLEELSKDIESFKYLLPIIMNNHLIHYNNQTELHRKIVDQIEGLIIEYNSKMDGYKYVMKARLYDFMTILLRDVKSETCLEESLEHLQKKYEILSQINEYLDENYAEYISLEQVSKFVGYSTFYFTRIFREFTGTTFKKYLTYYRLEKARRLLLETDIPIVDVAYQSGFNSIKTFNRIFKEYSRCTPTDFRKAIFEKL